MIAKLEDLASVEDASEYRQPDRHDRRAASLKRWRQTLGVRNLSAVYFGVVLFVVFSVWVPKTFLTVNTLRIVLSEQSVTALLAIGLVVPLAAGAFDLSIGYTLGAANVTAAWAMQAGHSPWTAVAMALAAGFVVGIANGILVVRAKISSFIATLGVSSILASFVTWRSNNHQLVGLDNNFKRLANNDLFGLSWSVYFLICVALIVWYVLEHRPTGRYVYAAGGSPEAARLSGVRTSFVVFGAMVTAGLISALAGVVLTSRIGVGSPSIGPPYLIPAFAAAFLGSTQLRAGRFNVWGTLIAVYVLAMGVKGLQLAGVPFWIPDLFNGAALLLAVGLSGLRRRTGARSLWRPGSQRTRLAGQRGTA